MKIKNDPFVEMDFGFEPGSTPDTDMVFVVYRGHEYKWGTIPSIMPGTYFIKDTDVASNTEYRTEIVCACDSEDDARWIVQEKNRSLGRDDVHYKYHGEMMYSGLYPGFDISQLETVAVILDSEFEYTVPRIEPVYAFNSEETILAKTAKRNESYADVRLHNPEKVHFVPFVESNVDKSTSLS